VLGRLALRSVALLSWIVFLVPSLGLDKLLGLLWMVVVFCTTVGGETQRDLLNSPFIFMSIFVPDRAMMLSHCAWPSDRKYVALHCMQRRKTEQWCCLTVRGPAIENMWCCMQRCCSDRCFKTSNQSRCSGRIRVELPFCSSVIDGLSGEKNSGSGETLIEFVGTRFELLTFTNPTMMEEIEIKLQNWQKKR